MNVVAILCIHNEAHCLARTLEHLREQGVQAYILDNDSTDGSRQIADSFVGKSVLHVERLPRKGVFELKRVLKRKEELHHELEADWYINQDADEIREAPFPYRNLAAGLGVAEQSGFNAVDFDEFVFLPTTRTEDYGGTDFVAEMKHYCYLKPADGSGFHIKAWRNTGQDIDLVSNGGHQVQFEGRRVSTERFILRHYIALSFDRAIQKYCERFYCQDAFDKKGWHGARAILRKEDFQLPSADDLCTLDGTRWDRSNPVATVPLFGDAESRAFEFRQRRLREVSGVRALWNRVMQSIVGRGHRLRSADS